MPKPTQERIRRWGARALDQAEELPPKESGGEEKTAARKPAAKKR